MANGAINYKIVDSGKLGGPAAGPASAPPGVQQWAISTTWPALAVVRNGGFIFRTVAGGAGAASGVGPTPQFLTDNACTWVLVGGCENITASDATAQNPLGVIVLAQDVGPNDYGFGEFMYVKFTGASDIKAGDFVVFDRVAKTCVGTPIAGATANGALPCGIAMGSHALSVSTPTFGWVMVRGIHDGANVTTGGTSGFTCSCGGAVGRMLATGYVAVKTADGVIARAVAANNQGTVELYWPSISGR